MPDQFETILSILPTWIRHWVRKYGETLEEIAIMEGKPPSLWLDKSFVEGPRPVTKADIESIRSKLKVDYGVEFREDGRAGISGTLHRISGIYDRYGRIVGMTIRLARVVKGLADPIAPFLFEGKSLLIIGPPGVGKTTLLRDVIRQLAAVYGPKVVVVDTSNEIGGEGTVPHPVLGASKRLQVRIPNPQLGETHLGMLARTYFEAVANHGPQIIVGDEVTSHEDVAVVETIGRRGVWAVVTVHGKILEDVLANPVLHPLIGYPIREKRTLAGDPVFDMAMEVRQRGLFHLYLSLKGSLKGLLSGDKPPYVRIHSRPGGQSEAFLVEGDKEIPYPLPQLSSWHLEMYRQAEERERAMYQVLKEYHTNSSTTIGEGERVSEEERSEKERVTFPSSGKGQNLPPSQDKGERTRLFASLLAQWGQREAIT